VAATSAHAEVGDLNLGPRGTNGTTALAGTHARGVVVVHALACHDEIHFLERISSGEREGDWPIAHMSAKAALLTGAFGTLLTDGDSTRISPGRDCYAPEGGDNIDTWRRLFLFRDGEIDREQFPGARSAWDTITQPATDPFLAKAHKLQRELNRMYVRRFGDACANVTTPQTLEGTHVVTLTLTRACLMRQIAVVMTNEWHGAWKITTTFDAAGAMQRTKIPKTPGTSASKLPCPINWALVNNGLGPGDWTWPWDTIEGVEGDEDMGVIEYTRLTHLLYVARTANPDLRVDADAALTKLNRWLLTLRGEPAAEKYNVFWSCGNFTNGFGSAEDTVEDNDVYNQDLGNSVSGEDDSDDSFWEKLWKFLRVLLAAAAIGLLIGAALGWLLGAGLSAAIPGAILGAIAMGAVILVVTVLGASIPETENHLLMQNSSKYLKNKLMMAELRAANNRDGFDDITDDNDDVREWLLERFAEIVEDDFLEYNSKPYNGLSSKAILNLIDFACDISWSWDKAVDPPRGERVCDPKDAAIVTAASAVYDLSAAKVALGSHQNRRLIPFRRLVEENLRYRDTWQTDNNGVAVTNQPRHFLDLGAGADHLLAPLLFWTGNAQHGPGGRASSGSVHEMLWYATSRYLPHEMIVDLALDKSTPFEQTFEHETLEHYSSGPRWLLTAGGDDELPGQGLELSFFGTGFLNVSFPQLAPNNDRGVGVPTTLMVSSKAAPRDTYQDFLRFEGTWEDWSMDGLSHLRSFSNNGCVTGRFACGLRFEIPPTIDNPTCLVTKFNALPQLRFIDSAACAEYDDGDGSTANDFFAAVWRSNCAPGEGDCGGRPWGFIEIADPSKFNGSLDAYAAAVVVANKTQSAAWARGVVSDEMAFYSVQENREIRFTPDDEDFGHDCRACGAMVKHESGARFTINHPRRTGRIFIDLNDDENPIRRGEGGIVLVAP
jgi:hypothetical protein